MKAFKRLPVILLLLTSLLVPSFAMASDDIITITMPSCWIGSHAYAPYLTTIKDMFKEQYGDRYALEIDELPGDAAMDDKLKVQISARNMPDVFTYNSISIVDSAAKAGLLVDMKPYIEADAEWADSLDSDVLDAVAYDGAYYIVAAALRNIGYFYNAEMFDAAGIDGAPETWDEFFAALDKLKEAGFIPLAMDNGWINLLWFGSLIGTTPEGEAALSQAVTDPAFFTSDVFLRAAEDLQRLYVNYTTADAVGNGYEEAANYFFSEQAAIIANGPWMIGDFSDLGKTAEGFAGKIRSAQFPGNGVYEEVDFGYVSGSADSEQIEAAVALIKLMTGNEGQLVRFDMVNAIPVSKTLVIPEEISEGKTLFMDLIEQSRNADYHYQTLGRVFDPLVGETMTSAMPALGMGQITALEFGEALAAEMEKLAE